MAVTILSTTAVSLTATPGPGSYTVTIPSTAGGSCIIVAATSTAGSGPANFVDHVQDNVISSPSYSQTATVIRANDVGISRGSYVFYRPNVEAGVTQVLVVPNNVSSMNMRVVVYEVAGIAPSSPLDANNTVSTTDAPTTTTGAAATATLTNSFYVTANQRGAAATWTFTGGSGFAQDLGVAAGTSYYLIGQQTGSGLKTVAMTHPAGGAVFVSSLAIFKPYTPSPSGMMLMFD